MANNLIRALSSVLGWSVPRGWREADGRALRQAGEPEEISGGGSQMGSRRFVSNGQRTEFVKPFGAICKTAPMSRFVPRLSPCFYWSGRRGSNLRPSAWEYEERRFRRFPRLSCIVNKKRKISILSICILYCVSRDFLYGAYRVITF
jgi:hypothetical protein